MKFWGGSAFMPTTELPAVARMLDESGYHGLMMSDHLVYPRQLQSPYPYSTRDDGMPIWEPETAWPDSWVVIGALAAVTTRLQLSNNVYIAPARPLLEVAKQVATASVLSGGRVALGLAAGWMREEFELLGQRFDNRGRRLDEMIEALRALWQGGWVSWHGTYYEIPELMLEPHPPSRVPIFCGGISDAALRRAARLCDGWVGNAFTWDDAAEHIAKLRRHLADYGRVHEPFEIVIAFYDKPSVDLYKRAEAELGVTGVMCMPWAHVARMNAEALDAASSSADRYRAPIEQFAEQIVAPCS
jgi:probable F420-dependent oxidoreductase